MNKMIYTKLLFSIAIILKHVASSFEQSSRPNIVFILADDLGWNDVSFHGSKQIPTPNLDALAYDGILLGNYYVQPICTPTRGALLTGRHPIHTGLQHSVIVGSEPYGLPLNETIMPEYLNSIGYTSHIVGKWHLGFHAKEYTPTKRGFHSHYGYFQGMEDYWDHSYEAVSQITWGLDFRRNETVVKTDYGKYSTHLFADEATNIIKAHDVDKPLYLYLPFQAVHSANQWKPLEAPQEYVDRFPHILDHNRRIFAGMVSALDDAVGNITRALQDKGILNNTIIAFSTDNGGPAHGFDMNHANNFPLRGVKATLWEGGMRGCGFLWSPLLNSSGYTFTGMMQVIDWLPTLLHAAGFFDDHSLPTNVDGIDLWMYLNDNTRFRDSVRTEMLHNIDDKEQEIAIRHQHMKLIFGKGLTKSWDGWYAPEGIHNKEAEHKSETLRFNSKLESGGKNHQTVFSKELPEKLYPFHSTVKEILSELGRPSREERPFVVECLNKPMNASHNCKVSEKPCLFNITADPCEYNNLAEQMPEVVQKLMQRLQEYNATAVPPGNKPQDPRGFPIHHGGIWVPWLKLNESEAVQLLKKHNP